MLGIVLGLGASLCWGLSDFLGGLQSRTSPQAGVMLTGGLVGSLVLLAAVLADGSPPPGARYLLAAVLGGFSVTIGLLAFYRALAIGTMGIVAPVASTGVVLPVIVGIAAGERLATTRLIGMALSIVGVIVVSRSPGSTDSKRGEHNPRSILLALIAALGFGGEFVALHGAAQGNPVWAAFIAICTYSVALAIIAVTIAARRLPVIPARGSWRSLVALGALFGGANALFATATRHGQLAVVAVASSLYPIVTMLVARAALAERLLRPQAAGVAMALAGVLLIAAT